MSIVQRAGRQSTATSKETVPHFLILGAAKCGTTSLHLWLSQHPQLLMSFPKEPPFFEVEYERGREFYLSTYFQQWDGTRLLGDARTSNLFHPWVPERVHESNPNAKLIAIVRNPIDRCLSHWWMEFRRSKDPLHFEEAVLANLERLRSGIRIDTVEAYRRVQPVHEVSRRARTPRFQVPSYDSTEARTLYRTYVDAGYYDEQIERYRKLFPAHQLRVLFLKDLRSRPQEVLAEICEFLGISKEPLKEADCRLENVGKPMKRNRAITYWLSQRLRGHNLAYADVRERPAIRPEFRQFLADHYRPFNSRLSELLSRDLSHWT